jgi:hypothetical protein
MEAAGFHGEGLRAPPRKLCLMSCELGAQPRI